MPTATVNVSDKSDDDSAPIPLSAAFEVNKMDVAEMREKTLALCHSFGVDLKPKHAQSFFYELTNTNTKNA